MPSSTFLLNQLKRNHVLSAIEKLDVGQVSSFSDSTKFDVIYAGKRYPPKRVAGLALQCLTGEIFTPDSFKGGESSSCFKALNRCGFTVVPKPHRMSTSLKHDLTEVLQLQTEYSSSNTPAMQERGKLIRANIPAHLEDGMANLEPAFSKQGFSCAIQGSDGVGRKNESAWVRIFDPIMSPSATTGWYLVLHFSRKGDIFFSAISCGATFFKDGSLVNLATSELIKRVSWAQIAAKNLRFRSERFSSPVNLHGNSLSSQFEKAIAFARAYRPDTLDIVEFWSDLEELCILLVSLYELEQFGKNPHSSAPQISATQDEINLAINPRRTSPKGQGRGLSYEERVAVELCAMEVARLGLIAASFSRIKDVSANQSYDFSAIKNGSEWFIEVKGTTSENSDAFLLTARELQFHHEKRGTTALALVSGITLRRDGETPVATGGNLELIAPWDPDNWSFQPTAFRAERKQLMQESDKP